MPASYDPDKPLDVTVTLDSPQYITFGMWYKKPGDKSWTPFAGGKDDDSATSSEHHYRLTPLPEGSTLFLYFHFVGNAESPIKVDVSLTQDGAEVLKPTRFRGHTNGKGIASREKELVLQ